jgi:hypothetical protein
LILYSSFILLLMLSTFNIKELRHIFFEENDIYFIIKINEIKINKNINRIKTN